MKDMPDELKDILKEAGISKEDLMPTDGKNELFSSLRSFGLGSNKSEAIADPFAENANSSSDEEKKESETKKEENENDTPKEEEIEIKPEPKLKKKRTELSEDWKPTDGIPHNMADLPLAD